MTMRWLLPETRQAFQDNAQASAIASDVCPFTVLFSFMADYWLRLWLEPQELETSDGWPAVVPNVFAFYNDMVREYSKDAASREIELPPMSIWQSKGVSKFMEIAELSRRERTPLWHARVAQALLLNRHPAAAREHFRTALGQHEKTPTLDPVSLSVIHRDLSRSCSEIGRHAEALEHHILSKSLAPDEEDSYVIPADETFRVLNAARLQHRAKQTEGALATVNEAWKSVARQNGWLYTDFESFFRIFLDLHHPQDLRPVFDRAATFYDVEDTDHFMFKDFADFLERYICRSTRLTYRVLQYVLTPDDADHLDRLAFVMEHLDTLKDQHVLIPEYKYLVANVLFTKGRVHAGLDGWCQVLTGSEDEEESHWSIKYPHARATSQLVTVCLEHLDIAPCDRCPVALSSDNQKDEACLG
ncbi:hypothetical protein BDW68DRAFT_183741 [Aspergillus falconensis]